MIVNTQSSNTSKRINAGWHEVVVADVAVVYNPNDMIRTKVTVYINNKEIAEVVASGLFPLEIPIWNRQNSDGSYGGEYELLNFYRATGAQETRLENNKTDIDLDSMKGRKVLVRFYNRPGSSYVDAHAKTVLPVNADQGYKDIKEQQFQKDYAYMQRKYESKLASSPVIETMIVTPETTNSIDDKLPF